MIDQFAHTADVVDENVVDHMMDSGHWLGDGGFTVLWMILLMIVVVLAIAWVVKNVDSGSSGEKPLDIAKARYAKGEINKKEYEALKKELSK